MPIKQIIESSRVPVKIWTNDVDEGSVRQLKNVADLPFVFHHVAAMPDVHVGMGATIGSVIATKGAVIPAAVGVDIGCGMAAVKLNLERSELTEKQLVAAFQAILRRTPVGLTQHREKNCRTKMCLLFSDEMAEIESKNPGILDPMQNMNWRLQMGTLGSGNHFIELEVDEEGSLANWIIPGKKMPWRLYDENGQAQCDLIAMDGEVIEAGKPVTMVNLDSDAIERTVTFTPTAVKPLLVPHILGGQLAMELPSIAEKKAYIAKQLTEETWESELRLECPHKHYVNMTPAVAECRARMYAELHGGKV